MIKKIMTTFLALTMVASMSSVAFAEEGTTDYGINIGGVEVTSENASKITDTNITGKVSYNPKNNTLTLNNATISGYKMEGKDAITKIKYGLTCDKDININLVGENKISNNVKAGNNEIDFLGKGSITISSPGGDFVESCTAVDCGSLGVEKYATVKVSNSIKRDSVIGIKANGIGVFGKLIVTSSGTSKSEAITCKSKECGVYITETGSVQVTASVNKPNVTFAGQSAYGIYAGTSGEIDNLGKLTVTTEGGKTSPAVVAKIIVLADGSTTTLKAATKAADVDTLSYFDHITFKAGTSSSYAYAAKPSAAFYQKYFKAGKKLGGKVKPTTLKSLTKAKKAMTVKWNKRPSYFVNGYQIQYSTSSKFKSGNKTVKVKGSSVTSKKITKLKSKKKYYVRIRTYRVSGGTTKYSSWSSKKYVTTK